MDYSVCHTSKAEKRNTVSRIFLFPNTDLVVQGSPNIPLYNLKSKQKTE